MFFKISTLLCVAAATCILQVSSTRYSRQVDEDLFLDSIDEEDLKDVSVEDLESEGSGSAESKPVATDDSSKSDCNSPAARRNTDEYVDKVLSEVRPKLPEPAFLPERVGRFRLFNGTLENLVSMKRAGPALVRCSDRTFKFLVPIGLTNLTGKYFWETDAGVPVFRGFIDMFISNIEADVLYSRRRTSEGDEPKAKVDKLTITKLQGVKVNFDGLGPLNVIASRFSNLVVRFFSRGVSRALEGPVKNAINKELQNVEKYELYYYY